MALDAETGEELWEFNVGAPVGIGGPSIADGMLPVPMGHGQTSNKGGYVVAFGLPKSEEHANLSGSFAATPISIAGNYPLLKSRGWWQGEN